MLKHITDRRWISNIAAAALTLLMAGLAMDIAFPDVLAGIAIAVSAMTVLIAMLVTALVVGYRDDHATPVMARYLTLGGATVELRRQFRTDSSVLDGYRWECQGCGQLNEPVIGTLDYMPNEERRAHADANAHAGHCRTMPQQRATASR